MGEINKKRTHKDGSVTQTSVWNHRDFNRDFICSIPKTCQCPFYTHTEISVSVSLFSSCPYTGIPIHGHKWIGGSGQLEIHLLIYGHIPWTMVLDNRIGLVYGYVRVRWTPLAKFVVFQYPMAREYC